jgi:hypothetical protein
MTLYHPVPVMATKFSSNTSTGGSIPASFDAGLYRPMNNNEFAPMKLTIWLRIRLNPLAPRSIPIVLDSDKKPFWTIPWTPREWSLFVEGGS